MGCSSRGTRGSGFSTGWPAAKHLLGKVCRSLANFTGFTIPRHLGLAHGDEEPAVARSHPRVYLGSSGVRSSSFNARMRRGVGFDAASGMDSLVSITFQCQDLRLVRLAVTAAR